MLEVGDDACDPKQAVAVANQMVNKKFRFMHGHWCSSRPSRPPMSMPNRTFRWPPYPPTRQTDRGLKNIFAIAGRDDQQGMVAGSYLADRFRARRSPSADDKSAYIRDLADEIAKTMEAKKVKPALRESITAGEKDYSGLITKLKSAGVAVMAYGGYHTGSRADPAARPSRPAST